tara:strand:+ start:26 stop:190 length:165 start_codon:yes stop_codon:yes gene_type:complete
METLINDLMSMSKKLYKIGDAKKDRKGRTIFFKGYSTEYSKKGRPIELWEPSEK